MYWVRFQFVLTVLQEFPQDYDQEATLPLEMEEPHRRSMRVELVASAAM
jgi:hypothetical protein